MFQSFTLPDHSQKWEYTPSFQEDGSAEKDLGKEKLLDSKTEDEDEPKTLAGKALKV